MKGSIVVETDGGPLGVAMAGANIHNTKLLAATLAAMVVARPQPPQGALQHRCLDKDDDNPAGYATVAVFQYVPHVCRLGEEQLDPHGQTTHTACRWVVEQTLIWLSKCWGLLVRYDKKAITFLGQLQLASGLLWLRHRAPLYHN